MGLTLRSTQVDLSRSSSSSTEVSTGFYSLADWIKAEIAAVLHRQGFELHGVIHLKLNEEWNSLAFFPGLDPELPKLRPAAR